MKLLIATCATGEAHFARMTSDMLSGLNECIPPEHSVKTSLFAQRLDGTSFPADQVISIGHNAGFAKGMNSAIKEGIASFGLFDYVMVINNDTLFPDKDWLRILMAEADGNSVLVPLNTKCNTSAAVGKGPRNADPFRMPFVPAVCWMVPMRWIIEIHMRYGYYLFDPDFKIGWAEDDYAAWVFRKLFDAEPFKVVPKAWIKHLGSQTVDVMVKKHGVQFTKENMALLKRKTSRERE